MSNKAGVGQIAETLKTMSSYWIGHPKVIMSRAIEFMKNLNEIKNIIWKKIMKSAEENQ